MDNEHSDAYPNLFAAAVVRAYVRAHFLAAPDDAAGFSSLMQEPIPEPEHVIIPFGCVRYEPEGRAPKIVPQMYVGGRKISLGHYPHTTEGAELAARVRAAADAEKKRGGDLESVKRIAQGVRCENL